MELALPAHGWLPTQWALIIEAGCLLLMLVVAGLKGRLRALITSDETFLWFGGVIVVTSTFFVHAIGPMGGTFSPYTAFSHSHTIISLCFPVVIYFSNILGMIIVLAMFFFDAIFYPRMLRAHAYVISIAVILQGMLLVFYVLFFQQVASPSKQTGSSLFVPIAYLLGTCIVMVPPLVFVRDYRRRVLWVHLLPTTWFLITSLIFSLSYLRTGSLRDYRLGYWLNIAGIMIIFLGSLYGLLRRTPVPSGHCRVCRYNLTGNTSGICPECGEPVLQKEMIP